MGTNTVIKRIEEAEKRVGRVVALRALEKLGPEELADLITKAQQRYTELTGTRLESVVRIEYVNDWRRTVASQQDMSLVDID